MKKKDILVPLLSILAAVGIGATVKVPLNLQSFNAGELSPLMNSRSDYPKYPAGAKTLENMLVRSQGPVQRRPGTKYIAAVKDATDTIRLIPFEYSTSDAYVLELGDAYMRFYRNGGQILDPNNNPYEISTPWDSNDVFEIQYAQDAQYMRLVHPDYAPYKLTRSGHANWTLTKITFVDGPFIDENTDESSTITPSAITGNITLAASAVSVFDVNHVDALWQISHLVESQQVNGKFWTSGDSNSEDLLIYENQNFTVTTAGDWYGTFIIQRSYDNKATWEDVKAFASWANANVLYSGTENQDDAYYRVFIDDQVVTSHMIRHNEGECNYTLATDPFIRHGVVRITAVVDANDANGTVVTDLASTAATWRWAEGSWSTYRGFPRTVEHHEQRCIYGGSDSFPQTVWSSVTASQDSDYDDFDAGTAADDDAWTYILPGMNPIQWLKSQTYLMVGTSAAVGRLGTEAKSLTPTWVEYKIQAKTGSAYIQPVHALDAVLFVERGAQKVREVQYTYESDHYVADDMTVLAEHIAGPGITQIDFQNRPDPILWAVRSDGILLSFTYNPRHNVEAWSRHDTGGTDDFNSVAVIPGADEDVVYTAVARTVNSAAVKYIEYFQPLDWGADQNDCWFVDSGKSAITGLSHLEGETVGLWANGRPIASQHGTGNPFVVTSGAIDPNDPNLSQYTVGLTFTSVYESMPVVIRADGINSGLMKTAVLMLNFDFYKTLACNLGRSSTQKTEILFSDDEFATTIDVFSGVKSATFPRGVSRDMTIYMDSDSTAPWCLRSINPTVEIYTD